MNNSVYLPISNLYENWTRHIERMSMALRVNSGWNQEIGTEAARTTTRLLYSLNELKL